VNKRDVVIEAIGFRPPPYVPWAWSMTQQCEARLGAYLHTDDLTDFVGSHFTDLASGIVRFDKIAADTYRDVYGVVWDRTVDKDIGSPVDWPIRRVEDLDRYSWPDADDDIWYVDIPETPVGSEGLFRRFSIGFSLYERAWTMRGMEDLLVDMVVRPEFVEKFMDQIVDHNMVQIRRALGFDVDCVHFGDDYGAQRGLIMGIDHWRHFIKPRLARMFEPVRAAGKYVSMHSCGAVSELFDDLIDIGLNMFNPFQPEVMDVFALKNQYQGRLAFHGGMSIQHVLPFGSVAEVQAATESLIEAGREGGYIFSPSHAVPPDVPPENLVAMMEVLRNQPGF